jgi:hypothetical protein
LAEAGLNIVLPLGEAAFDQACAIVGAPRLRELRDSGVAALLIGSGGRVFFDRFIAATDCDDGKPNPLDRFTRAEVEATVRDSLGAAIGHGIFFPFVGAGPPLPFQRLGRAAGLGAPGPLGMQIHPQFGPWWAYRALVIVDVALPVETPPGDGCAGCDAPCVAACPARAVAITGFVYSACRANRLCDPACHLACAARSRCIRGPEQRYSERQLAFHMAASMPKADPDTGKP